MEIYFSSDLHLGHRSVIGFQNRPFENVEEMDNGIIHNFNSVVHRDDILYILGDLSYRIPESQANELIKRINGRKILIRGNHDGHYDKSTIILYLLDILEVILLIVIDYVKQVYYECFCYR